MHPPAQLEHWPISRLVFYARNPRKNDHAVDAVAAAIREFGFRVPILAKSGGTVIDGHLRLKAARKLGLETVPVLLGDDMTETQIKAFRLSVNIETNIFEKITLDQLVANAILHESAQPTGNQLILF